MPHTAQTPLFYHGPFSQFTASAQTSYVAIARGPGWYPHRSDYDVVNDEAFVAQMAHEGECVLHFPQATDTAERPDNLEKCWAVHAIFERLPERSLTDVNQGISNRDPRLGVRLADFTWPYDPAVDSQQAEVISSASGPISPLQHYSKRDGAAPVQGDLFWVRNMLWRVRDPEPDEQYHGWLNITRYQFLREETDDPVAWSRLQAAIAAPINL